MMYQPMCILFLFSCDDEWIGEDSIMAYLWLGHNILVLQLTSSTTIVRCRARVLSKKERRLYSIAPWALKAVLKL